MADIDKIKLDDVGTLFRVRILDGDSVIDLQTCLVKEIIFQKPDGTTITKTATFYTDGSDGYIQYISIAGDIDQVGIWNIQGHVEFTGQSWHTSTDSFLVSSNL